MTPPKSTAARTEPTERRLPEFTAEEWAAMPANERAYLLELAVVDDAISPEERAAVEAEAAAIDARLRAHLAAGGNPDDFDPAA